MRKLTLLLVAWAAVCAAPIAAGVWDTKPYTEWSDKDLDKVMTDSPWAGKAGLTHARQGASLGPVPDWDLIVAVRSALPFKQALVRRQIGQGGTPTPQHEAQLAVVEDHYVVSIGGIPRAMTQQLQKVADGAEIRRRGKMPIKATQGALMMIDRNGLQVAEAPAPGIRLVAQRGGGRTGGGFGGAEDRSGVTATLVLGFPRTDAITSADNEFEFVTVVGGYNVKRTFKLKDMIFKGQLAL